MTVFVELTTDAFDSNFRKQSQAKRGSENRSTRAGRQFARRPLRGIEVKEDTYAMIKVVQADGTSVPLIDSTSSTGVSTTGYTNFILQTVSEARVEKTQIVETFGDSYIFFFGESPRFIDASAILLNTHDFNWRAEWWANYGDILRGTRLVELGSRVYLFYDDTILEGYLMHANVIENSQEPYQMQLSFRLFVTNYSNISMVGNPNFPIRSSVVLPDGIDLQAGNAGAQLVTALRDEALDAAEAQAFDSTITGIQQNPIASERRISDALRAVPASFGVSQSVWTFLFSEASFTEAKHLRNMIVRKGVPIRGLIAENVDEFVGGEYITPPALGIKGTVRDVFEVDDLWRESIQYLSCYGADIDDPGLMLSVGLGPNFKPTGSLGFGGDQATFNPLSPQSVGNAFNQFGESIASNFEQIGDNLSSFAQDPLGSVFGVLKTQQSSLKNRPKYTEGAGDPLYGYPSDFSSGPGFGTAGFGDFGGNGFGSAQGEHGDPGFKDPEKFTFAGVSDDRSAFDRFLEPKEDTTSLSIGGSVSLGTSGLSGGAGVSVGGSPTAFALISVPGILDPLGLSRQDAEAIAEKQAQQKFGFSTDNPFGTNCAAPGGFGFSEGFSEGKSFSLP